MPARTEGFYRYAIAVSAFVSYLLLGGAYYSLSVLAPLMAADLGWSATALGAAFSIWILLLGLSGPPAGAFVARFGPRLAVLLSSMLVALALALFSTTTALWQFYAFTTLLGLGFGLGTLLPMQQLIGNWFFQRRSLFLGFVVTGAGVGGLVLAPLTGTLADTLGSWRPVWLILAAVLLLPGVLALFVIRDNPDEGGQIPDGVASEPGVEPGSPSHGHNGRVYRTIRTWDTEAAIRTRAFWLLTFSWGIMSFLLQAVTAHQVAYLADEAQVDLTVAASALGLIAGSSIVGRLASGWLGDRIEPRLVTAGLLLLMSLGLTILVIGSGLLSVYAYVVLFGIGYGGVLVLFPAIVLNYYGSEGSASISGVAMLLHTPLGALGAPIVGGIKDASGSYVPAFGLMIGIGVAGALAAFLGRPPAPDLP